jgi:hypothetical protein
MAPVKAGLPTPTAYNMLAQKNKNKNKNKNKKTPPGFRKVLLVLDI